MAVSIIDIQRDCTQPRLLAPEPSLPLCSLLTCTIVILNTIRNTTRGDVCFPAPRVCALLTPLQWKVLIVDEDSRKLIDNVVKEDDILDSNITNIERIEDRRQPQPETDAVYFLTPKPHIVDCLMADFDRRRYKGAFLVWTTCMPSISSFP